jgi:hypothetical protein
MNDNDHLLFALSLDCLDLRSIIGTSISNQEIESIKNAARTQVKKILSKKKNYYLWADMSESRKLESFQNFLSEVHKKKIGIEAFERLKKLASLFEEQDEADKTAAFCIESIAARFFWQSRSEPTQVLTPQLESISAALFAANALGADESQEIDVTKVLEVSKSQWDEIITSEEMWDGNPDILSEAIALMAQGPRPQLPTLRAWKKLLNKNQFSEITEFITKEVQSEIGVIRPDAALRAKAMLAELKQNI